MNDRIILAVDDTPSNLDILATFLDDYDLIDATNGQDALEIVKQEKIDLVLLDITMPQMDGFEVCKRLKSEQKSRDIPVIFLTAHHEIEYIQKGFEVGGADYINKPFNSVELRARVKTHLQNRVYLEQIKQKQAKLAQLSITDPLTKLYNNLFFETQVKSKVQNGEPFWILFIKINNFEKINEVYGYIDTIKIVKNFARLLSAVMMKSSSIIRIYDGSFCVLLKNIQPKLVRTLFHELYTKYKKEKELAKMLNYSYSEIYIDKAMTINAILKYLQNNLRNFEQTLSPTIE